MPRVFLVPSSRSSSFLCSFWEDVDVAAFVVNDADAADAEVVDADADAADVVNVMAGLGGRVAVIIAANADAATAEAVVVEAVFFLLLLPLPPQPSLPLLRTIPDCMY